MAALLAPQTSLFVATRQTNVMFVGGSASPAVFSGRNSPQQCMVSIGDSKVRVVLRLRAEQVPLLLCVSVLTDNLPHVRLCAGLCCII